MTDVKSKRYSGITAAIYLLYIATVFFLCLYHFKSNPEIPSYFLGIPIDKIVHFSMMFPFPFLTLIFLKVTCSSSLKGFWLNAVILIFGICLAIITEFCQEVLTSYRTPDITDVAADLCGIVAGCLLIMLFSRRLNNLLGKHLR